MLGAGEGPLPGLQTATFSLCPHMVETECAPISFSSYNDTNLTIGALLS